MNDIVGTVFQQIGNIAPLILRYHILYAFNVFNNATALLKSHKRDSAVGSNGLIRKKTNCQSPMLGSFGNDVNQSRVDNIAYHSKIDGFRRNLFIFFIHNAKVVQNKDSTK